MAKRGRPRKIVNGPPPEDDTQVLRLMTEKDLLTLLRRLRPLETAKSEATSSVGEQISEAVQKRYLDKTAFTLVRRLNKLNDSRLQAVLAHFDHYRDVLKLDERASTQGQMFVDNGKNREPMYEDNENVTSMHAAAE